MKQKNFNFISTGASGLYLDQVVLKNKDGKVTMAKPPKKRTGDPHPNTLAAQQRMQRAFVYGELVLTNPLKKAIYEDAVGSRKNIYKLAVTDFLNAPQIRAVDNIDYTGSPDGRLMVLATDDVKVASVTFELFDASGTLIESGPAMPMERSGWWYTATKDNPSLTGTRVVISATDLPGNTTVHEHTL
ncbi:hypothetical protein [uncultured Chitinophaga sp.]|uniref:hypothetical protein n=1 Tax=uncultured Chitinophaga sp. TaxID=339340 RepID=UPI0025D76ECC|nr:hypothetical protein [uncultured Chitinophaga sp.]